MGSAQKTIGRIALQKAQAPAPKSKKRDAMNLTAQERKAVEIRLDQPTLHDWEVAQLAGYGGSKTTRKTFQSTAHLLFNRPKIKQALAHERERRLALWKPPDRDWLLKQVQDLAKNPDLPVPHRVSVLRLMAEMIPKALVPKETHTTGELTLEAWVANMGGRPETHVPSTQYSLEESTDGEIKD